MTRGRPKYAGVIILHWQSAERPLHGDGLSFPEIARQRGVDCR
jgi:hypothetical protein